MKWEVKILLTVQLTSSLHWLRLLLCHSYSYMIDNVVMLITGALKQKDVAELLPRCHPMGAFDQMAAVGIARTPAELYATILVDTPLGRVVLWSVSNPWIRDTFNHCRSVLTIQFNFANHSYSINNSSFNTHTLIIHVEWRKKQFCCVKAQFFQDALSNSNLDEMEIEILRNKLHKVTAWLLGSQIWPPSLVCLARLIQNAFQIEPFLSRFLSLWQNQAL